MGKFLKEYKKQWEKYIFHPRFIAALLCIGDLCDLDNGRFNTMAIEVFGGKTEHGHSPGRRSYQVKHILFWTATSHSDCTFVNKASGFVGFVK